jgi:hypothetical protein
MGYFTSTPEKSTPFGTIGTSTNSSLLGPLDGSRLKIVRAEQHLKLLRAKIGRHLKKHTQEIVFTDSDTNTHTRTRRLTKPIPAIWSTIVGDCVTNCRAALDYIMWELAVKYLVPTPVITNREDRRITNFPISESPTDTGYTDRLNRFANRQLPAPIIDEIKLVQPYNAGYEPLRTLHELVNTDKHRMPLMGTAKFGGFMLLDTWALQSLSNPEVRIVELGQFTISTTRDTSSVTVHKMNMNVNAQPTISVTWQDVTMPHEPVDRTLEDIVKCVANIIPRFQPFL